MNCVIVDDEPLALDVLSQYIEKLPSLVEKGRFQNAHEAIEFLKHQDVDLIFLDIQMPDMTGFDLLRELDIKPLVIITTAFERYALKGYELDVIDYLLKPISFERFLKSIQKASLRNGKRVGLNSSANVDIELELKSGYDTHLLNSGEILLVEGEGNYLSFITKRKKVLTLMKMDEAISILPDNFERIHKSYIVNLNALEEVSTSYLVINGNKIPVGRTYRKIVKDRIANK